MAQKIPIYGELDCRTAENIIADAEQIRYSDSKNVKEAIDEGNVVIYNHSMEITYALSGLANVRLYIRQLDTDSTKFINTNYITDGKIVSASGYYYDGSKDIIVYNVSKAPNGTLYAYYNDSGERKQLAIVSPGINDTVTRIN